ncbi:hypothetical protein DBR21_03000, partial [Caulobacter sp. HMWF009]
MECKCDLGRRFLVLDDNHLTAISDTRKRCPERSLNTCVNRALSAVSALTFLVGCEGRVDDNQTGVRSPIVDAIAEEADGEGSVKDASNTFAMGLAGLPIDDDVKRLLIELDTPFARPLPNPKNCLDL